MRDGRFMCGAGVSGAHILADGSVVGCPFMPRSFATGNVRETRFSEIWERGFTACRQRGWTKRGPCAKCQDYADCRGGCLLQWDSPEADAPRVCMMRMLQEAGDG